MTQNEIKQLVADTVKETIESLYAPTFPNAFGNQKISDPEFLCAQLLTNRNNFIRLINQKAAILKTVVENGPESISPGILEYTKHSLQTDGLKTKAEQAAPIIKSLERDIEQLQLVLFAIDSTLNYIKNVTDDGAMLVNYYCSGMSMETISQQGGTFPNTVKGVSRRLKELLAIASDFMFPAATLNKIFSQNLED